MRRYRRQPWPNAYRTSLVHLVFSTKNRQPWIDIEIETELHKYLAGTCRDIKYPSHKIGGSDDHLHIACTLARTMAISTLVEEIKTSSSKWMKTKGDQYVDFAWQNGYGAFSIGQSQLVDLIQYIATSASIIADCRSKMSTGKYWPSTTSNMTSGMCGIDSRAAAIPPFQGLRMYLASLPRATATLDALACPCPGLSYLGLSGRWSFLSLSVRTRGPARSRAASGSTAVSAHCRASPVTCTLETASELCENARRQFDLYQLGFRS